MFGRCHSLTEDMHKKKPTFKTTMADPSGMRSEKLSRSAYIVFIALIIDLLGFTVILPLIPSIHEKFSESDQDTLYHWLEGRMHYFQLLLGVPDTFNPVLFGGLLGSLFSCLQFLASPIIGALSDVYGRRPILIFSMIGISLSHAVWAIADNFSLFVLARIIGGICRGNVSLSAAIMTDVCSPKSRGKGMALIGIAFSIGFLVGPTIGAAFTVYTMNKGSHFYQLPAIFALALSTLDVLFLFMFFQESLPSHKRASSVGSGLAKACNYISPLSLFFFKPVQNIQKRDLKVLQQTGFIYFLFLFLYSGLEYSLSFLTHNRFMFTSMQQGKMYLFSGIIMTGLQAAYVRKIPAGDELRIALIGVAVVIPSFIIIGLARNINILYLGLTLYAFASATVVPCLTTMISKFGSDDQKGTVLGIFRSLGALARGLGPLLSATAYWCLGSTFCYLIGGTLLIFPFLLIKRLRKKLITNSKYVKFD